MRLRTKCWRPTASSLWRYSLASSRHFIGHNEDSQVCHICMLIRLMWIINVKNLEVHSRRCYLEDTGFHCWWTHKRLLMKAEMVRFRCTFWKWALWPKIFTSRYSVTPHSSPALLKVQTLHLLSCASCSFSIYFHLFHTGCQGALMAAAYSCTRHYDHKVGLSKQRQIQGPFIIHPLKY